MRIEKEEGSSRHERGSSTQIWCHATYVLKEPNPTMVWPPPQVSFTHLLNLGPINHHTISSPNLVQLQVANAIKTHPSLHYPLFKIPIFPFPYITHHIPHNSTNKHDFLTHVSDPILPSFQRKWLSRNAPLPSSGSGCCNFLGNNNIIVIFGVSCFNCCRSRGFGFVQRGSEEAMGEVRGRDKGLHEERSEGLVGNLRHCRGCCSGLRPGCFRHARLQGSAQLPSWDCLAIASEDGVWFWPRVFPRSGVEKETLHK